MLRIEHLTKHYPGSQKGVTDLSLHVAPGDLYAFIGHNGAGKTTTLKAVAGIHGADGGEIYIDGISLRRDPLACKRRFAYIPDNPDLYEYLTGIQYLNFVADVFGTGAAERQAQIGHWGDAFQITASLGDLISTYSHGMKQKLALIGALLHSPRLLILDEPFVGLDPAAAVTGTDALAALGLPLDIAPLLPFVLSAALAMMSPTACSVSMEGRQVWLMQTLPVPMGKLLQAKMALHLSLWTPFALASSAILAVSLRPGLAAAVWLLLLPLSFTVFASVFGLAADLRLHRFDWEREEAVVKQGAASMLGGLIPALLAVLAAFGAALAGQQRYSLYCAAVTAALLIAAWLLYRRCCQARFEKL